MLDQAFEALKTFDWGQEFNPLAPIEEAIVASQNDDAARAELEQRLAGVLQSDASRSAKDYVCRKLKVIGTAASVPVLQSLLADTELSHMARYALQSIPGAEAAGALRAALSQVSGTLKTGMISSLGARQDNDSVAALAALLGDSDAEVARSAACALGAIRSGDAAEALAKAAPNAATSTVVADASLACAESLLGDGQRVAALAIYKRLAGADQPKHVRLAATRGMLACASQES